MKLSKNLTFLTPIMILVIIILILYLPTLNYGFVLDDHNGIEKNVAIRSLSGIFSDGFYFLWRIIHHAGYLLGGSEPWGFRLINIFAHIGTTVGLYLLLLLLSTPYLALFSAILFSVHPLLIESVVWISSSSYPLYSMFVLISLSFYIAYQRKNKKTYLFLSLILFIISWLLSEKALILPFLVFSYNLSNKTLKKFWKTLLLYCSVALFSAIRLVPMFGVRVSKFSNSDGTGFVEYLNPFIQIPVVLGTYINLIFWPMRLTIYHLDELGIQQIPLTVNVVLTVIYFVLLVFSFLKNKKIFFFLSLFFIANLPALIPIHIIQIAAERYAYLGSAGLIAAVVMMMSEIFKKYKINAKWLYAILSLCALVLAWRTSVKSRDWESEMSLRLATLSTAPYSARAHNNVGIQLMNEGNDEEALIKFKKSISLKSDYSHPYHNIGHMLAIRGRYKEAVPFYLKAMDLNKNEWKTHQDLGQVYFILQHYPNAKKHLQIAIDLGSPEYDRLQTILTKIKELGY